ncbi:MAG TPA: exonuclease domain-containing protein [Pyrinomonadaceae bacterium]|jgi:DNA polymerase III epsilon subunit family exonuclease|nr:exonuclease domain-containing protein [Pyrinomonadaceae bacterium]
MQSFRNLVPDSTLVQEAVQLLRKSGGRAPAADLADSVLQLPNLEPGLAALLVGELIKDDWRLRIADDSNEIELVCEDDDCRVLAETDYIVVDVETTGPKTPPSRIIEIGAYHVKSGRIVNEFQTLVNPQIPIPPFIVGLTGITDAMVAKAPLFGDVAADWLRFADRAVLVAHNAAFDVRFINHEVSLVFPGRRMVNPHLCTVSLARRVVPEIRSHRLHSLAEHFAVPIRNRHRAAGDALATAEVFLLMLEVLQSHGVSDLAGARLFKKQLSSVRC